MKFRKCPFCGSPASMGHKTMKRFDQDVTCSGPHCVLRGIYFRVDDWNKRATDKAGKK